MRRDTGEGDRSFWTLWPGLSRNGKVTGIPDGDSRGKVRIKQPDMQSTVSLRSGKKSRHINNDNTIKANGEENYSFSSLPRKKKQEKGVYVRKSIDEFD